MTLENNLRAKLAETPAQSGRHDLHVSEEPWNVYITADKRDELSCLVWELTLRRANPGQGSLAEWGEQATGRVTGLLEPLKVYEIDNNRREALLRSAGPARRDGQVFYYEVLLHDTSSATVRRFQAHEEPGQKRVQIPFAVTNEALIKLVTDLTA